MPSPPSPTLYLNNLNDHVNKEELRTQLYALFTTHGKIIDIVASKTQKMRGQAFLVFADLAAATAAMRACEGMIFYDKPLVCLLSDAAYRSTQISSAHRLRQIQIICHSPQGRSQLCPTHFRPRQCPLTTTTEWEAAP